MFNIRKIAVFVIISFLLIATCLLVWVYFLIRNLPSSSVFESRRVNESTKIYDSSGKVLLFEIYGEEKRTIIQLAEISKNLKDATLAVEDAGFYNHSALEVKSTIRAIIANILNRGIVQGGSTITQQLAKKAFLSDEKTISRKIKELILAYRLEKRYSKDEILELYLNQIPYGNNTYGIESASLVFFKKSAKDIGLAESALLAALPQAPSFYSPWGANVKALMARKDYVLERMFAEHWISEEEKNNAQKEDIKFESPSQNIKAPHFVMMVKDYLDKEYGEETVRTGGLKVITTLNWDIQQLAEKILTAGVERNTINYKGTNAALVIEDPKTGQILSLVGSKDYFDIENDGNFNVAYQGLRQPGSSLKPIIYASLFKKGFTPESILFDTETEFDTTGIPENSYKPQNYTGSFRGPIDIRHALSQSINIPAVKALYLSGLDNALKTANDFGLKTLTERGRYGLSLVLGGGEVTLFDLVGAYSVFSQEGIKKDQKIILEISDKKRVLEKYQENPGKLVIDPLYSGMITDILSDNEARRQIFGNSLDLPNLSDYQIAVKTGTSNDYRDAWTVGYTP
ncbi:MAG: penicillin-binding protein, partial [Candidatus Pacebacteria bacterium]|nr:penicillin-binding protein [Candidatus Paceibacterota bacterium]